MLKKHLNFMAIFCLLAFLIQIKNTYFTNKISHFPKIPNGLTSSNLDSLKDLNLETRSVNKTKNLNVSQDLKSTNSFLNSNENPKNFIIKDSNQKNLNRRQKNSFVDTYQKKVQLKFNNKALHKYQISLKDLKKEYRTMGFIVDQGSIELKKISVTYTNGETESLKLPYKQIFLNDWFSLKTKQNLKVKSIDLIAKASSPDSKFSFYLQNYLRSF